MKNSSGVVGPGGYNAANVARCWTALTALVVGQTLSPDIPEHENFLSYGPSYELHLQPGTVRDHNTREYLDQVLNTVCSVEMEPEAIVSLGGTEPETEILFLCHRPMVLDLTPPVSSQTSACLWASHKPMKSDTETYELIKEAFGDAALSRSRTFEWFSGLLKGRKNVNDDQHTGRPRSIHCEENKLKIKELIKSNRRISIKDLSSETGLSVRLCYQIVTKDLDMIRTSSKFVPRILTEEQKKVRMDVCKNMVEMTRPIQNGCKKSLPGMRHGCITRFTKSKVKTLLVTFLNINGLVHHEFIPFGRKINQEVYLGIMRRLREAVRLKRSERWQNNDWILHVDNARPHTAHVVLQFLVKHSTIQIPLSHPPYSPDLAPNDFFLYPKLKMKLKVRKFDNVDMIQAKSKATLRNLSKSDFISCFDIWRKRWNRPLANAQKIIGITNNEDVRSASVWTVWLLLEERLVEEGLAIGTNILKTFLYKKLAEKSANENLQISISNEDVVGALWPYFKMVSLKHEWTSLWPSPEPHRPNDPAYDLTRAPRSSSPVSGQPFSQPWKQQYAKCQLYLISREDSDTRLETAQGCQQVWWLDETFVILQTCRNKTNKEENQVVQINDAVHLQKAVGTWSSWRKLLALTRR
ncbi:hypothetical protein LAZ67_23000018 [Cordylochernes scorpioides]|uniref:Transposase n=1 Tax=Cordylochernes scorpioides TaxID=51811 RepID=A0ABY6LPL3_9ARAC|nr:hypothetical protein LAZ67_23000018 [Cordylochernes scorpioides]